MKTEAEVIDIASVRRTVSGDVELLAELVEMFGLELPGLRARLATALQNEDRKAVSHAAHRLKGSLATLGARCVVTAERLEKGALSGTAEEMHRLAAQLESELDEVVPVMRSLLQTGAL